MTLNNVFVWTQDSKAIIDGQNEHIIALQDWQDSAEKKLQHIKDTMDELGPEVSMPGKHIL